MKSKQDNNIFCRFEPMFEFFHNMETHSSFWATQLNVVQINYYTCVQVDKMFLRWRKYGICI